MPDRIGDYEIRGPLGATSGSLRARDVRLGRTAVLRPLPPGIDHTPERLDVIRAAQALSHPNLAGTYELVRDGSRTYLAYEFVPGEPLTKVLGGRPLHPRTAALYAAQLADALAEAHAAGLVHGDVRPDTIVVTAKGQAKLIELGLAGFTRGGADRAGASTLTGPPPSHGSVVFPFLSPEQALGGAVDSRSDVFSLGAVLYTMLTGRPPFEGTTPQQTVLAVVQATPPPPSRANSAVPVSLDRVVGRALAKSLDQRIASAAELAASLRAVVDELAERAAAAPVRVPTRRRRGGLVRWIVIGTAAAGAAAAAWLLR